MMFPNKPGIIELIPKGSLNSHFQDAEITIPTIILDNPALGFVLSNNTANAKGTTTEAPHKL